MLQRNSLKNDIIIMLFYIRVLRILKKYLKSH